MLNIKTLLIVLFICVTFSSNAQTNLSDTASLSRHSELVDGELPAGGSYVVQLFEGLVDWYMDNMNYGTLTLLMAIESS
ncbi:MAG: hypothetical protein LBE56_04170, partial [Tannerella sp.]|nr:hypothetical protein [Tannerella sp.]